MNLAIGDTVKLKSGGPIMTITGSGRDASGNPRVTCTWIDRDSHAQTGVYPIEAVERADVPTPRRVAISTGARRRGSQWAS